MTSDELVYRDRVNVFNYYFGNDISVKALCFKFNRSRTWFYRWRPRYRAYGEEGLRDIDRSIPAMPNQVSMEIESAILDFICRFPAYGPQHIADELTHAGTLVKRSAVYNVLKRHNLNTRKKRLEYLRIKNGVVKTVSDLDRDKEMSKHRSLNTRYPGHIVGMDTFYVGTIKDLGRVYQFTGIDTYSSYGWAKPFLDKTADSACAFLSHVQNSRGEITFHAIMTDNGKEFTTHWESKNHDFEKLLKELNIQHRLTKVRHPWTNGACERLNRTILEEFYQVAFRTKIYTTLEELDQDLQQYILAYNTKRTHHGKRTQGKLPVQLFQEKKVA
jgi:transposase InsO family protein